jgi:hypothetical protein
MRWPWRVNSRIRRVTIEERLARREWKLEWADIVRDLDQLQDVISNLKVV